MRSATPAALGPQPLHQPGGRGQATSSLSPVLGLPWAEADRDPLLCAPPRRSAGLCHALHMQMAAQQKRLPKPWLEWGAQGYEGSPQGQLLGRLNILPASTEWPNLQHYFSRFLTFWSREEGGW